MTLGLKRCQDFFKEFVILEKKTLLFYEARMNNFPNFLMPKMKFPKVPKMPKMRTKILTAMGSYSDLDDTIGIHPTMIEEVTTLHQEKYEADGVTLKLPELQPKTGC